MCVRMCVGDGVEGLPVKEDACGGREATANNSCGGREATANNSCGGREATATSSCGLMLLGCHARSSAKQARDGLREPKGHRQIDYAVRLVHALT